MFVGLAFVAEILLRSFFPYPFLLFFFAAVIASAWTGGVGPGLFAVGLSILAVDYFYLPPINSFVINAPAALYFASFVICALVATWVSAAKKKSESALRDAHDDLELRVDQRTTELRKMNAELMERERELEISNAKMKERERQLELSIEQRSKAEQALTKTQAELAHLSRMLTMGELTSSIAHEITQPLTAIVVHGDSGLDCLSAAPPKIEEARDILEKIIEDGTRAGAVLSRIRALFRKETLAREWVDLNEVVRELAALLQGEATSQHVSIRTNLAADLPRILGDRIQLQQVMLNLMMNGMDAMAGITDRPKELLVKSGAMTSEEIVVSIEDSGIGIDPKLVEKIFDPFFTTKPQGLGMGLSISRSIIESHRGRLWAKSRDSGGAEFVFTIPGGAASDD